MYTMFPQVTPYIPVVDLVSHFCAACFLRSQSTSDSCNKVHKLWLLVYISTPDFLYVDQIKIMYPRTWIQTWKRPFYRQGGPNWDHRYDRNSRDISRATYRVIWQYHINSVQKCNRCLLYDHICLFNYLKRSTHRFMSYTPRIWRHLPTLSNRKITLTVLKYEIDVNFSKGDRKNTINATHRVCTDISCQAKGKVYLGNT